jgi:hypothetical protein
MIGRNRLIWDLPDRIGDRLITDPKRPFPFALHRPQSAIIRDFLHRGNENS